MDWFKLPSNENPVVQAVFSNFSYHGSKNFWGVMTAPAHSEGEIDHVIKLFWYFVKFDKVSSTECLQVKLL